MKTKSAWAFLLCLMCTNLWAQKITVSGTVVEEETSEPVFSASVVLLNPDSTMACGASSNMEGRFTLPAVKAGKYIFRITYVGFKTYFKNVQLSSSQKSLSMGTVKLQPDAILLKAAEVTARAAQVEMKEDTFVYNAAAYRVPEGSALEALVRKLPGAEVTDDGTIKINGKEVKKIMVDGKEFFDNDTKIAMKNLPTSMVEKIKAYDRQSDYTRTTGIDDGEEETVLDLSVKKDMKQGWLMNADVGYGTEERYTGKVIVNRFTDRLQLSAFGSANNVNDNGFPGGGFRGWGGGGGGLVASKMAGLNFSWENGKKEREGGMLKLGGNVRYSHTGTDALSTNNSETFLPSGSGSSFSNSRNDSRSGRTNVNANFRVEWMPDSMTRIMFRPNFSFSENDSRGVSSSVTFNENPYLKMKDPLSEYMEYVKDSMVVNDNRRNTFSDGNNHSVSGMLMANRRLNSSGRNLTLRLNAGYSDSDNKSFNISDVNYFLKSVAEKRRNSYMRQYNVNPSKSYNASADLSYSEPLFKGAHLQFGYKFQYRYSDSDRSMYSLDSLISKGEITKEELMNYPLTYVPGTDWLELCKNYENSQYATYKEYNQDANVMFRYIKGEMRLNAGVSLQPQKTYMDYQKGRLDTSVVRQVINWAPRIDFRYKISETSQVRVRYNGRSAQPSMTNLLDVTDDSDPLNISKGNPGLKPSWTNSFNVFYNNYITEKQRGWMVHARANMTSNSISTAVLYDEQTGGRISMPMNINGNWNANTNLMFNTAMGPKKYFNIWTFTNVGYTNSVNYISTSAGNSGLVMEPSGNILNMSKKSTTKSTDVGERLNLNFRNDLLEVGVNGSINYQHARNALQENANLDTYNFSYGANLNLNLPWNMSFSTDINEDCRRGYDDASMNTNELIWNAQISQSFLKENAATVSVQWYDILQQKSNISRSISATRRADTWNNAINSYVMVHFIYKLNLLGNKEARAEMRGFDGGFGGPGGLGGGGRRGPGGFGGPR